MSKTFDLSTLNLSEGTHEITVKARASGYLNSDTSNVVSYTVGTPGLAYGYYSTPDTDWCCKGMGTATATDIIIASTYQGIPVTRIYFNAFRNNTSLTSVVIPDSVTIIDMNAFEGCSSLKSVIIPDGVTDMHAYTFQNCTGLTTVTIGNGVTEISHNAFNGCSSLTSVTIPDGVTTIGEQAFYKCYNLTSVIIPESVTYIDTRAFCACNISSFTFKGTVKEWNAVSKGSGWISGSPITQVQCSDGVVEL